MELEGNMLVKVVMFVIVQALVYFILSNSSDIFSKTKMRSLSFKTARSVSVGRILASISDSPSGGEPSPKLSLRGSQSPTDESSGIHSYCQPTSSDIVIKSSPNPFQVLQLNETEFPSIPAKSYATIASSSSQQPIVSSNFEKKKSVQVLPVEKTPVSIPSQYIQKTHVFPLFVIEQEFYNASPVQVVKTCFPPHWHYIESAWISLWDYTIFPGPVFPTLGRRFFVKWWDKWDITSSSSQAVLQFFARKYSPRPIAQSKDKLAIQKSQSQTSLASAQSNKEHRLKLQEQLANLSDDSDSSNDSINYAQENEDDYYGINLSQI
ncbi:hypothetical protein HHK36_019883 [Tetracentron sinense]|uniref:Uncharacterized protein n=1 Tax=Tetracentron sinense TaxID=13715 RepID=A0A835D9I3_TETSI|nr:hypothetical protein HHK36_019883 [Tetracentron sinense]